MKLNLVEDNTIDTAVTDHKKVYYNRKFIEGLNKKVRCFVLAHEWGHRIQALSRMRHGACRLKPNPCTV